MACVVEGCKSHTSRKENNSEFRSFHRFPKDEIIKSEWVQRLSRYNWAPKKHSHICSKHFTAESFVPNENVGWRRLKANAVPTLHLSDETNIVTAVPTPMDEVEVSDVGLNNTNSTPFVFHFQAPQLNLSEKALRPQEQVMGPLLDNFQDYSPARKRPRTVASHANMGIPDYVQKINDLEMEIANCKKRNAKLEKELERVKKVNIRRRRKLNTLSKRIYRRTKNNSELYEILMEKLKAENIEQEHLSLLESINKNDVVKRFLRKQGETLTREYSLEIKKIAVTLHYLSPRAYTFIRDQFQDVLPHPKTICAWYKGIDCNPGFTTEALDAIKTRVEQNPGKKIFCALAIDEMAIRRLIEWDSYNMKYYGYVDLGHELDSDSLSIATQALTFMVTCQI